MSKPDFSDSRYAGLTYVTTIGAAAVTESFGGLVVKFLEPLPPDLDLASSRLVIEGDGMVRSFVGTVRGDTLAVDDKHVPATFEALKSVAGKNVHFLKVG